jgi:hypothetical protein
VRDDDPRRGREPQRPRADQRGLLLGQQALLGAAVERHGAVGEEEEEQEKHQELRGVVTKFRSIDPGF